MEKKFKILSIDGGGIRGIFPAHILQCIEDKLEIDIYNEFDLIAGTSTGAIVGGAIANEISPTEIVSLFQEHGKAIFSTKQFLSKIHLASTYSNKNLSRILKEVFSDKKLGDVTKPLLLPSSNVGIGGVHVLKSGYSHEFTRDKNVLLSDAILASCSAPTYFNPIKLDQYLLGDGGLWANNPTLAAIIDAKKRMGIKFEDIQILSLGTGHSRIAYGTETKPLSGWGFLSGWRKKKLIGYILSLQSEASQNMAQLMLEPSQLLRLNFISDKDLPLDDCSKIEDLLSQADQAFTHNTRELRNFFNI